MAFIPVCLLVAGFFFALSLQDSKDPLKDFCRRWGHQTAQVDGKLYVDGGLVAWRPVSSTSLNYTNTWLLYSDLNSTQSDGQPRQYANVTKGSNVPSVSGGILWSDEVNKCFYLFGGEFQGNPEDFSFWAYDAVLNQWNESSPKTDDDSMKRVSYGAGTQIEELGRGYYYGGWMNNHTSPGWSAPSMATSNMIVFDYSDGTLKNISGPDAIGRAEGSMVYLPSSDNGLLVYFGGLEDRNRNGTYVGANMSEIHIFDVASSKWYTQHASGAIPAPRRQFCAGATWADDKSSYNIYFYGGFDFPSEQNNITAYDDTYILTLPSFTWIKAWPNTTEFQYSAYGHGGCSANVINRDQLLIIGGWFPDSPEYCDTPDSLGQHNMNMGENGPEGKLWDKFDPKISTYFVPTAIIDAVGGGPTGGASITSPSKWDDPDLPTYFTLKPTFSARAATRTIPKSTSTPSGGSTKSNVGAIAGGAVGGLVTLIIILSLILFCLHRRKKELKAKAEKAEPASPPPVELSTTAPVHEMDSPGATKYIAMQQPNPNAHPAFSGSNSVHSRTPSDGRPPPSPYSPHGYPPQSYPSPYETEFSPIHPTYQQGTYAADPSQAYNNHNGMYAQHSPSLSQQRYPFPGPMFPVSPQQQQQPQQVYYPPPPEPSNRSHPSFSERIGSPEGTQYSGDTQSPLPPSTSNTPAHFYAQPSAVKPGYGAREGAGDDTISAGSSNSSRKRPIRGRFVEVDHM